MNHRAQHLGRFEPFLIERMAGLMSEGDQKSQLRAPVAFSERMDGIELGEEMGGALGEISRLHVRS